MDLKQPNPTRLNGWKQRARQIKTEVAALYFAYRDPRVSWGARIFAALVVGYALSPIDLIPDPIPVLGYLDDLILVPLGIWLALKMIPPAVMVEARAQAQLQGAATTPVARAAALSILLLWILLAGLFLSWVWRIFIA